MTSQSLVSRKCEMCGHDALQIETRTVQVEVEVCVHCALEWDVVRGIEKTERRQALKKLSYSWADGLHGKRVVVHCDEDTHPIFCDSTSRYHVTGVAYRISNASSGWGQVRVDIDSSENYRIRRNSVAPSYGMLDGQRFGLFLNDAGNGGWYTIISWGCRKALDLVEVKRVSTSG